MEPDAIASATAIAELKVELRHIVAAVERHDEKDEARELRYIAALERAVGRVEGDTKENLLIVRGMIDVQSERVAKLEQAQSERLTRLEQAHYQTIGAQEKSNRIWAAATVLLAGADVLWHWFSGKH